MLLSIRPLTKRHVEPQHYLNKILFSLETRILPTWLGPRPSQLELHERQKVPAALRLHLYFAGWDLQHLRPFPIWLFPPFSFFHVSSILYLRRQSSSRLRRRRRQQRWKAGLPRHTPMKQQLRQPPVGLLRRTRRLFGPVVLCYCRCCCCSSTTEEFSPTNGSTYDAAYSSWIADKENMQKEGCL